MKPSDQEGDSMNYTLPLASDVATIVAKELMRRTLCVMSDSDGEMKCGNCTHAMSFQPSEPHCPVCGIKWFYLLPAFLYCAFGLPVNKEHENLCFRIAADLGGLAYITHPKLAHFCRAGGYNIDVPWVIV